MMEKLRLVVAVLMLGAGCSQRPLPFANDSSTPDVRTPPDLRRDAGLGADLTIQPDLGIVRDLAAVDNVGDDLSAGADLACSVEGGPPVHAPTALDFNDTDPVCAELSGVITIHKAIDECGITHYRVYWGSTATTKLDLVPIAALVPTGGGVQYALSAAPLPPGAAYLLAYSANGAGENPTPAALQIVESLHVDISAGQGAESGYSPSATLDAVNRKLLTVTDDNTHAHRLALFRCDLDGSNCSYSDISAGVTPYTGFGGRALVDSAGEKLLGLSDQGLFRCDLDGSNCAHTDLVANAVGPSAVIDAVNHKLLVAMTDTSTLAPILLRCELDGSGCASSDISAGHASQIGIRPSALIDASNGKLLVVAEDDTNDKKAALFRCNLDGSGCVYTDLSAGQGSASGTWPRAVLDPVNDKLLVVTTNHHEKANTPALFRCNLDGSACAYADLSAGQGINSGISPSPVVDAARNQLLVVTQNSANAGKLALFRCNLDGSACTYSDISAEQGDGSGSDPSAVLDADDGKLLVVTTDFTNDSRSSLFSVCLH